MKLAIKSFKYLIVDIYWLLKGIIINNSTFNNSPKKLLYVCKGNICRSSFAENNLRIILSKKGIRNIYIDSAGIDAIEYNHSPLNAKITSKKFGVSLDNHIAKKLNKNMLNVYDAIILMEAKHMFSLINQYPDIKNKFLLLPLFYRDNSIFKRYYKQYNIEDPYGGNIDKYNNCFEHINKCNNILADTFYVK